MKALSVRQPWAYLIATGSKLVENRTWTTAYRGPLLIHASLRAAPDPWPALGQIAKDLDSPGLLLDAAVGLSPSCTLSPACRRGAIVGVVELVGVVRLYPLQTTLRPDLSPWYEPGAYAWLLENPRVIEDPIPYKGRLGLFDVPDELLEGGSWSGRN